MSSAKWLTAEQIERDYDINYFTLRYWCRNPCPILGRKVRHRGERGNYQYWAQDIEDIVKAPLFTGEWRDDRDALWLSDTLACERYAHVGVTLDKLQGWSGIRKPRRSDGRKPNVRQAHQYCPYLPNGRRLRAKRVGVAFIKQNGHRWYCQVWVYSDEDLDLIAAGVIRDKGGVTAEEAFERFGFDEATLNLWVESGCPHLRGRPRLRSWIGYREHAIGDMGVTAARQRRFYDTKMLERVAKQRDKEDKQEKNWIWADDAYTQFGFHPACLPTWSRNGMPLLRRKLKRKPASRWVGNHKRDSFKYWFPDLKALWEARQKGVTETYIDDAKVEWLPASIAERLHGVPPGRLTAARYYSSKLLGGRKVRALQVELQTDRRGSFLEHKVWVYHLDDVLLLAGKADLGQPGDAAGLDQSLEPMPAAESRRRRRESSESEAAASPLEWFVKLCPEQWRIIEDAIETDRMHDEQVIALLTDIRDRSADQNAIVAAVNAAGDRLKDILAVLQVERFRRMGTQGGVLEDAEPRVPANREATGQSPTGSDNVPRRRRGGQPGRRNATVTRDRLMLEAWREDKGRPAEQRRYSTAADLARDPAFNVHPTYARKLLRDAGEREN